MDPYFYKTHNDKPNIILDYQNNVYEIIGRSFPENARKFYEPVADWFDKLMVIKPEKIHLKLDFYYISSSSIIALIDVIKKLEHAMGNTTEVLIEWFYEEEDEDIKKIGENFKRLTTIPIKIIEKKD